MADLNQLAERLDRDAAELSKTDVALSLKARRLAYRAALLGREIELFEALKDRALSDRERAREGTGEG